MANILIKDVDPKDLVKMLNKLYDMAEREREQGKTKGDRVREERAHTLDRLLDILNAAEVLP